MAGSTPTRRQRLLLEAILQRSNDIQVVAQQVGIPPSVLYGLLQGTQELTPELTVKLAKGLGVRERAFGQMRSPRIRMTIMRGFDLVRLDTESVYVSEDRMHRIHAIIEEQRDEDEKLYGIDPEDDEGEGITPAP